MVFWTRGPNNIPFVMQGTNKAFDKVHAAMIQSGPLTLGFYQHFFKLDSTFVARIYSFTKVGT